MILRTVSLVFFLTAFTATTLLAQSADRPSIVVESEAVDWLPLSEALEKAATTGKKVMIDVYAPWCGFCRRMHDETYSNEAVADYVAENYIATRIDGDSSETYDFMGYNLTGSQLAGQLGARGFPTTVFLFPTGEYLTPLPGFVEHGMFVPVLKYLATDAFEKQSFEEFTAGQ
jgi:thioredoxin-related protein